MAFKLHSAVRETSVTGGTGDQVLSGSAFDASYFRFNDKYSNGDTFHYVMKQGALREFGLGTRVTSGDKIARTQVYGGSNGTSLVNFAAGQTIDIQVTPIGPSDLDAGGRTASFGLSGASVTPQGRLTLQSGVPVMTTTQSAKTTIYYTPYVGDQIPIYDGANMAPTTFAELSAATTDTAKNPAAIGASKVNDWFVWNDAGTLRLSHGPDWTNDTTRSAGTDLVKVKGIWLNNAAITNGPAASRGTWVGTTASNSSSQLEWITGGIGAGGTAASLGVWNAYNRVNVSAFIGDSTDTWTYATSSWRVANNSLTMRVSFICGAKEDAFDASYQAIVNGGTAPNCFFGVGLNNTTTGPSGSIAQIALAVGSWLSAVGRYSDTYLGRADLRALEFGNGGTTTFTGDAGAPTLVQSGLTFTFRM